MSEADAAPRLPWTPGETYEGETFTGVAALEANLAGCTFVDCTFDGCDLTMAVMADATVRGATFRTCRLLGVDIGAWRDDGLGIEAAFLDCDLDHLVVSGVDLRACRFEGGHAHSSEWVRADLRKVRFDAIDLSGARFSRCDLREADLRSALGYRIDPEANRVKGLRVALPDALGFLTALGLDVDL